ncbi:MAG: PEP-CTERM sorting domain-containing protein [Gemmatimonadaceae bacterium]
MHPAQRASWIVGLIVGASAVVPAVGAAQSFNFESATPGTYTTFVTSSGSQTLTVTAENPGGFVQIQNVSVSLLGLLSAVGSNNATESLGDFSPLRFSFAQAIGSITFGFGDNGGDSDTPAEIQAYDALNNLLGTFDTPYPAGDGDGATDTLMFGGAGASYFIVSSGTDSGNANSIGWEVVDSAPVGLSAAPEPASLALMATGLIGLGGIARRKQKSVK